MNHGVIFVAGGAFFVDGSGRYFIRLSFSQQTPERIEDGCVRLAAAIKEEHAALQQERRAHRVAIGGSCSVYVSDTRGAERRGAVLQHREHVDDDRDGDDQDAARSA